MRQDYALLRIVISLLAIAAATQTWGCGHPATKQECEEIFRRSAEVELRAQKITDPALIRQRIEEARKAKGNELLEACVGKRITDRAMDCVRGAKTAQDLDKCLK